MNEPALIRRSRNGDRRAYAVLVDRYWDRLYRWLCHLGHDSHLAEDLAQEALLKAFTALPSFQEGTRFGAWLFRIAYNAFLNARRPRGKVVQAFPEDVAGDEADPVEHAISQEAMRELARAVGRLPEDFRSAFLLRVEQDLSFRDVAEVLQITEETARWRVFKARQKLMEVMKPHLRDEEP